MNNITKIKATLLGTPTIYLDGEPISFSHNHVDALIYYILTVKKDNRLNIADMMWGDKYDDEKANNNFRNTLYLLRKALGKDIIKKTGRSIVSLSDEVHISIDIDEFKEDLSALAEHDSIVYLKGFYLKGNTLFNSFVTLRRTEIEREIFNKISKEYEKQDANLILCDKLCGMLITADPFCEDYYQMMMKIYARQNKFSEAEFLYKSLIATLEEELDTTPNESTTSLMSSLRQNHSLQFVSNTAQKHFNDSPVKINNENERVVLDIMALMHGQVQFSILLKFMKMDEDELVRIIESFLLEEYIVEKPLNDLLFYSFTDPELRDKIIESMSLTKRKSLHRRLAAFYEAEFNESKQEKFLPKLAYHYLKCGDRDKFYHFLMRYLYQYISISFDFFPNLNNYDVTYDINTYVYNKEQLEHLFALVNDHMQAYVSDVDKSSYNKNAIRLFAHMLSQYYVKAPDYNRAERYIKLMIQLSSEITDEDDRLSYILEAYKQQAYVYLNLYKPHPMIAQCDKALELCKEIKPTLEGFWTRLKGMAYMLLGKYEQANDMFLQSIVMHESENTDARFEINTSTSLSWLGEIARLRCDYNLAISYYHKALNFTASVHNVIGKAFLYLGMGQCLLDSGDISHAKRYLKSAVDNFEMLHVKWKSSVAYTYYARILVRDYLFEEAARFVKKAMVNSAMLQSPLENCLCAKMIADIKNNHNEKYNKFRDLVLTSLNEEDNYEEIYAENFKKIRSKYEKDYLKNFKFYLS